MMTKKTWQLTGDEDMQTKKEKMMNEWPRVINDEGTETTKGQWGNDDKRKSDDETTTERQR